jgi:nitrous oxide reductase
MSDSPLEDKDQSDDEGPGSLSRRSFLHRGAFTAAAVAVAGSVPALSGLVAGTAPEAPAVDAGVNEAADDSGALTEPLVAQLKDLTTGEISLFQGEREVVVRSPELARSLLSAAQK